VRLSLIVEAANAVLACEGAKATVARTESAHLSVEADYQALPYAGPDDKPHDSEYHP